MASLVLTPAQRRQRRAEAHHLEPVVMVGGDGLTDAVLKEADRALKAHGLIKVRMLSDSRQQRGEVLQQLADRLGAAAVQHIGKLLVLWRPVAQPPSAEPAATRLPGPRVVKILKFANSGNHRPQIKKIKLFGNQRVTAGGAIKRTRLRPISIKKKAPD